MMRQIYRTLIEPSFIRLHCLAMPPNVLVTTFTLLSEVLLAATYGMDFCRHLIDAAAKAIGIFWLIFFECGAAENKNFDKCHVKLLNICLIESLLQICHT